MPASLITFIAAELRISSCAVCILFFLIKLRDGVQLRRLTRYVISMNKVLVSSDALMKAIDESINTMIHELLHLLAQEVTHARGAMERGHKGQWARYAAQVSRETDYEIKRCSTKSEVRELLVATAKYEVTCQQCGIKIGKARLCKCINHPEYFSCGVCGGNLKRTR